MKPPAIYVTRIGGYVYTPWGVLSVVGPEFRPLWSERHRRGMKVLPLWGGWRIRWRIGR